VTDNAPLPLVVTFQSGADLLVQLNLAQSMTARGLRYIAETHSEWPFGEGRPHPYGKISNARVMQTQPFLDFFREHPPTGRGPDKQPRRTGSRR